MSIPILSKDEVLSALRKLDHVDKEVFVGRKLPDAARSALEDLAGQVRKLAGEYNLHLRVSSEKGEESWISAYLPRAEVPIWTKRVG